MKLSTVLQLLDPFSNPFGQGTAMRMPEDHELAERMIAAIMDNTRAIDEPDTRAYPEGLLKLEPEQIMEIAYQLVDAINSKHKGGENCAQTGTTRDERIAQVIDLLEVPNSLPTLPINISH
ncbi:hypothetical protein L873DRAFT_716505 [Choiromyces venosus 120613-1]|uniref:Uncharacterized protein n=1 Tax=Choiromyces venosus 120613-1 TaxID=1336337 RepID=A0A3N4K4V1_9PEZI|nr:hypothetical protein L873DRAFT_716505 [Choiromyces venosus 120613-1]